MGHQTSFAAFTCDILPTATPSERAAIQGALRAELGKPYRRARQSLGNQWLVRFDDGGFNSFVLVVSAMRAKYPDAFRYLLVGWHDMGSVALYPLGGAAPTTLSLVTAMAAVASGADELAAPLLLAAGPLTSDDFPLQWEDVGAEDDLGLARAPRGRPRGAGTATRAPRPRARTAPVVASPPVKEETASETPAPAPADASVAAPEAVVAEPVSEGSTTEAAETASTTSNRRKRGGARGKRAQARGARQRGPARKQSRAKKAGAKRDEEATQRRKPTASRKRAGGALSRKRVSAAASQKRSSAARGKARTAAKAAKKKTGRAATKKKTGRAR
ncbi:hypothetical protein LZ198_29040 [Myxococcus sp. K15C18031901]|uniref:hypothetical protein n=1 Tax=Myxococcus dinghuensis TaxID=2906761 RepID=UPI0020A74E4F|nr:hypothetical protein [Myxococcus dinghuensis]MCP3102931.1 hypothetical protein [Myxococcus dinghuensis]